MKTINYQLAKKLYDAGVVIESEKQWNRVWYIPWDGKIHYESDFRLVCELEERDYDEWGNECYPAPNCEEVIEFLKRDILIEYSEIFDQYIIRHKKVSVFRDTLLEALEATLEYLLIKGYIWNKN